MAGCGQQSGNILKLFVTNLPEGCSPWELRKCLECYGAITSTYVAKKRDKNGSMFGFVSVNDVRDRQEFLKSLGGVKMGDFRLKINVARFAAENMGVHLDKEVKSHHVGAAGTVFNGGTSNLRDARSYREVVGLSKASGGPNSVQNSSVEAGSRAEIKEIWGPWFSKLEPWNGQTLPLERVAWLKLCGIPLHLLDAEVLGMIGEAFGKIVHVPKLFEEDQDLSIVRVGVLDFSYLG
ncbi:putative RNA recognition motif domain, nucleotide-binding alpha-beta plait domain superfamily [Helianthus anomalus]